MVCAAWSSAEIAPASWATASRTPPLSTPDGSSLMEVSATVALRAAAATFPALWLASGTLRLREVSSPIRQAARVDVAPEAAGSVDAPAVAGTAPEECCAVEHPQRNAVTTSVSRHSFMIESRSVFAQGYLLEFLALIPWERPTLCATLCPSSGASAWPMSLGPIGRPQADASWH